MAKKLTNSEEQEMNAWIDSTSQGVESNETIHLSELSQSEKSEFWKDLFSSLNPNS